MVTMSEMGTELIAENAELSTGASAGSRVIMVCTGNICRSPMAALIAREYLARAGVDVVVDSAGTHDYHVGEAADRRAQAALAEAGYPTDHRARQFQSNWLLERDLVLAMDSGHAAILRALAQRNRRPAHHIRLIREFDPAAVAAGDLDVPDPYYSGMAEFRAVREMIEQALPGLADYLRKSRRD